MNAAMIERVQYGINIYTMKAHIVGRWKDRADCRYVTLCGRAGGGNSAILDDLPTVYDLCPRCAEKANA